MDASADPLDDGLRILARIIARDWARRHLAQSQPNAQLVVDEIKDHGHEPVGSETR
jgi:hypothetical protein